MNIAEKLSQLYQKCKMDSLHTLLEEKEYDLKYQQKQIIFRGKGLPILTNLIGVIIYTQFGML